MADEVKISRTALGALVMALLISLLGVSFLLGRQSVPTAPPTVAAVPQEHGPESAPTSLPLQVGPAPTQPVVQSPPPQPVTVVTVTPQPSRPPITPAAVVVIAKKPARAQTKVQPEVRVYFSQIDQVMSDTESMGDPNVFATQVLQQGMEGNSDGFDGLIASTRRASVALKNIAAPLSCREHHHLLAAQLDESLKLLHKVKGAMTSMDTDALSALASEGQHMQRQANRLKQLDERLRVGLK